MLTIFIHRLLQSFLMPPFNSLLIIVLGMFFFKLQRTKAYFLLILGCCTIYLQATPYVAFHLNKAIAPAALSPKDLFKGQALVVLGGGVNNSAFEYNVNAISNQETFARVRYAAFLAKKIPQRPIFVSGGAIDTKDSEASLMRAALREEFEVSNHIILEPDSKTTNENARYTARLLQQYGISTIVLISSASHMRRARALFEQNGIKVIPAPTAFYSLGFYKLPYLWFIPSASAMVATSNVLHELLGYWYDVEL
jgi:uncharacterized SAM-binding protein YcdF (DUF218 family)